MRKLGVAAALLFFAAGTNAAAQEPGHDLHSPSRSPETSPGMEPGVTRGADRGLPGPTPSLEPQEVVTIPPVSTTTLTSAAWTTTPPARREAAEPLGLSRTLLYAGAGILLGSYAASALTAAFVGTDGDRFMLVPVAGPWITLGHRSTKCGLGDCDVGEDINTLGIIASGVTQAAGLGLMIVSLFVSDRFGRF